MMVCAEIRDHTPVTGTVVERSTMKQEISPVVAVILIVVILAAIGGIYFWRTGSVAGSAGDGPPPMPPGAAEQLGEAMKRAGQQQGASAPAGPAKSGPVLGPGGVPTPPTPR